MKDRNPLIDVDTERLDMEWSSQMGLALRMIEASAKADKDLADAKAELELAKDELKATKAELYLSMRSTPSEFNLPEKPSETTLESAVIVHDRYKEAQRRCYRTTNQIIELEEVAALCKGRVYVARDKKEALQDLVQLHLTHYHSEPRVNGQQAKEYTAEAGKNSARKPLKTGSRK